MRNSTLATMVASALAVLAMTGCGREEDATGELEKAAEMLESAQPPPAEAPQPSTVQYGTQPAPPMPPAQQMNQALASYKSGNFEDAVTQLQKLRAQPVMTPQQRMALQDAMAAVMTDIYTRAANGDARAQQAVKEYERMQNSQ